jgi:murein DD-endopeptidase MepM/ murein hydrolase activator NlpD
MTMLMIVLFIEYRFFCRQVQELLLLKQQYAQQVDVLQKKLNSSFADEEVDAETGIEINVEIDADSEQDDESLKEIIAAENSDAPDNDDDYVDSVDDSFIVINRHPDYLRQSTIDYLEAQQLSALMTHIDTSPGMPEKNNKISQDKTARAETKIIDKSGSKGQKIVPRRAIKNCGFIWPIDSGKFWLSSLFGPRKRLDGTWGFHHGIDMAAVKGTAVKAVRAGTVVEASFQAGYGNTVVIKHNEVLQTRYAHLHSIRTYVGNKVKQGAIIGTVGETGFIRKKSKDGSHLHFEVYEQGKRINPMHCLPRIT